MKAGLARVNSKELVCEKNTKNPNVSIEYKYYVFIFSFSIVFLLFLINGFAIERN